jgi:hypothetical protein
MVPAGAASDDMLTEMFDKEKMADK